MAAILMALSGCGRSYLDPAAAPSDPPSTTATFDPCTASPAGSWGTQVPLDISDCASRADLPCDSHATTNMLRAEMAVIGAVSAQCGAPQETIFRVDVTDGCASEVEIDSPGRERLAACISGALAPKRWSCLGPSTCALYAEDTL
jgi:hypothetical protein